MPQPDDGATYAAKIGRSDAILDWTEPAERLALKVRAFDPFPGTAIRLEGRAETLKLRVVEPPTLASIAADLICDAHLHVEVKLTERLNPYAFIEQAINDSARTKRPPLVVMRSSYKPWLIMCRVDDIVRIAEEIIRVRASRDTNLPG